MKKKRKLWTPKEDELITAHYPHKLMAELLPLFPDRNETSIYNRAFFLGLSKTEETRQRGMELTNKILEKAGAGTRFPKGHSPLNKGMKQSEFMSEEAIKKTEKTRFKKGSKPHNTKKDGHISLRKDKRGVTYAHIKISDGNWELLHRHIWSYYNGDIPKDHVVIFINGNTGDVRIENLKLIPLSENMKRNSIHTWPEELKDLVFLRKSLNNRIKKIEKNGKKQD